MANEVKEVQMTQPTEKLSDSDKATLDGVKAKAEMAFEKAKTAVAQSESAKLSYDNIVLQLALRYKLNEGDTISDNGEIKRKSE
jgi:hypothetical protein